MKTVIRRWGDFDWLEAFVGDDPFHFENNNSAYILRAKIILRHELHNLPPRQRLYMVEYYLNGLNMPAISTKYGVAVSTVSRMLRDALKNIRHHMQYLEFR